MKKQAFRRKSPGPVVVDNWIRLGLVTANYSVSLTIPSRDLYGWIPDRPEYTRIKQGQLNPAQTEIHCQRGVIKRTAFGERFMHAVGLDVSTNILVV